MSLHDANNDLTIHSFFPDNVKINIRFCPLADVCNNSFFEELRVQLEERGCIFTRGRHSRKGTVAIGGTSVTARFWITTHASPDTSLNFNADFNVLRLLRAERGVQDNEISYDNSDNYLPAELLTIQNDLIAIRATAIIEELTELIANAVNAVPSGPLPLIAQGREEEYTPEVFISAVEATVDIDGTNSTQIMEMMSTAFPRMFREPTTNRYATSANQYEGIDRDARFVHGYKQRGLRYKVYEKTNQRVRLEIAADKNALTDMPLSRNLTTGCTSSENPNVAGNIYREQFLLFFHNYVRQIITDANDLIVQMREPLHNNVPNLARALYLLFGRIEPEKSIAFLDRLLSNGRIQGTISRAHRDRLVKQGIINKTATKGVYVPTTRYQTLLEHLRQIQVYSSQRIPFEIAVTGERPAPRMRRYHERRAATRRGIRRRFTS